MGDRDDAGKRRDEAGEHRDEAAEQRDEAAGQRDEAAGQRDDTAGRRDDTADERDERAAERDHVADQRDADADQRDRVADLRDRAAERSEADLAPMLDEDSLARSATARQAAADDRENASRDRGWGANGRASAGMDRRIAHLDRGSGASGRREAESDREISLADRGSAEGERDEAEQDRDVALADRGRSAQEREHSSYDGLTGVYQRGAGFLELDREIARVRRAGQTLVLAFVDVDHLKAVNDSDGHAAGDRLLRAAATALKAKLRSHDLVIRYGGDEFVCAIAGLGLAHATARLHLVNAALSAAEVDGSVTVGLAELRAEDSADDLVARADRELYAERRRLRAGGD